MPRSRLAWLLLGLLGMLGLMLGGCMQATLAPSSNASLTPRDRQLLAHPPYAQATIPETYRRHIVDYSRREVPGTILVDTDARYLYYVLPSGKAIRYGVTVGEEANGLVRRCFHWPYGGMAGLGPDAGDSGAARPLSGPRCRRSG